MFFKTFFKIYFKALKISILSIVLIGLVFGCAGEDQAIERIKEIKLGQGKAGLGDGQCIKDFSETVSLIIKGEIREDDLASFWACVGNSIKLFSRYVKGDTPGQYSSLELRSYIERNFLEDEKLSDDLLYGMMGIKRLFLGGNYTTITQQELNKATKLVRLFAGMTYRALPYMKIYFKDISKENNKIRYSDLEVEKSLNVLDEIILDLSSWITKSPKNYEILEFKNFLVAWEKNFPTEGLDSNTAISDIIKHIPLIQSLKVVLVGPDKYRVLNDQWEYLFKSLSQGMNVLVRFNYYIGGYGLGLDTRNFKYVNSMAHVAFEMLAQGQRINKDNIIPHLEFGYVIEEISALIDLPLGLTSDSIKKLWEAVVDYGLKPLEQDRPDLSLEGFTPVHLEELRIEYEYLYETQMYLNSLIDETTMPISSRVQQEAIEQVHRILDNGIPLLLDSMGRVYLDPNNKTAYDFNSFFTMNWQRAIIRVLIRGFSLTESSRRNAVDLKRSELAVAAKDLKNLLVALGVAGPNETAEVTAKNIHQLAVLFMPHSRGNLSLSLAEGVEYFSFIFSGINAGDPLFEEATNNCLINKNNRTVSVNCYRELFHKNFSQYMGHMPRFVEYFDSLDAKQKNSLQIAIENSVREKGYSNADINQAEINKGFILSHYIEIYLIRFDSDTSSVVDIDEALRGFPVFAKVLKEIIEEIKFTDKILKSTEQKSHKLNAAERKSLKELKRYIKYTNGESVFFDFDYFNSPYSFANNFVMLNDEIDLSKYKIERCVYIHILLKGKVPKANLKFWAQCQVKWHWKKVNANRTRLMEVLAALSTEDGKKK